MHFTVVGQVTAASTILGLVSTTLGSWQLATVRQELPGTPASHPGLKFRLCTCLAHLSAANLYGLMDFLFYFFIYLFLNSVTQFCFK